MEHGETIVLLRRGKPVAEIISALNRRQRERVLTITDYRKARRQLLDDIRDATVLQVTPSVISRSLNLLEKNVLRAMDAIHVACALVTLN